MYIIIYNYIYIYIYIYNIIISNMDIIQKTCVQTLFRKIKLPLPPWYTQQRFCPIALSTSFHVVLQFHTPVIVAAIFKS